MLLHKFNVNVAIANILVCQKSLDDLQKPSYEIWLNRGKRAWSKNHIAQGTNRSGLFLVFIETLPKHTQQKLACFKTFPSKIQN